MVLPWVSLDSIEGLLEHHDSYSLPSQPKLSNIIHVTLSHHNRFSLTP
jgi:hypothetical protein